MTALNISVTTLYSGWVVFYLYEWFYGDIYPVTIKGIYYFVTVCMLIYTFVSDITGSKSVNEKRSLLILKCSIWVNFLFFALMQLNLIPNPIMNTLTINGCIFAAGIPILVNGLKYGTFKD